MHSDFPDKVAAVAEAVATASLDHVALWHAFPGPRHTLYPIPIDLVPDFEDSHVHFIQRGPAHWSAVSKPASYVTGHSRVPKV